MIDRQRLAGTAVEPRGHCFISFIKPCLPSKVFRPPFGPLWVHEIKHDGYRLMVRRDGAGPMFHPQSGGRGCSIGEICDIHDLASGVIGGPFADLFSAFEVA